MDWMDEVLDGKPLEAEWWKISYIENLLHHTSISTSEQERIMSSLETLSDIEADEILKKIKENEIHSDPKHQYEAMRKNGMFNPKDF
ncbi:MAG: hypothetical protein Unbinned8210contig1002_30 [Prokaryotic dsDNA virus sp.]|nr:MAG: hypothetical protein Unbinned8210contig1002_30 [Prokaryotic dsDNA virus sp.]|tara:strand:+ start:849 stop:1109 length:261 start_codon:yes stop_codon:yes gene_type:complete